MHFIFVGVTEQGPIYMRAHTHLSVYIQIHPQKHGFRYLKRGFPGGSAGKESTCSAGDLGSIPELGRSTGEEIGYPLQYSGLENSMDYSPWGRKELDTAERLSQYIKCLNLVHQP